MFLMAYEVTSTVSVPAIRHQLATHDCAVINANRVGIFFDCQLSVFPVVTKDNKRLFASVLIAKILS
jgi:hypothetical protein